MTMKEAIMHFNAPWHAEGLRWIAGLFESAADLLETTSHETDAGSDAGNSVEEIRLRAHLRGFY